MNVVCCSRDWRFRVKTLFYCIGRDPRAINSMETYCELRTFRLVSSKVASAGTERSKPMVQTLNRLILKEILVGWLVGCFGLSGPLRQYFSLYRVVSQRERKRGEKG